MSQSFLQDQVASVVRALADLPGTAEINVFTRHLPRFGPADLLSAYEDKRASFDRETARAAGLELPLCNEPDEIIITVRGALPGAEDRDSICEAAGELPDRLQLDSVWNLRVRFNEQDETPDAYEMKVFTDFTAPMA